ncbi:MAG: hypothetical protein BRD24_02895 [Halobacteriales archaeon SW_9_67_24]|nr:MAG: hypothetical protein BRD24_02895 [Halobacteriales archaeon SW_9_67_24]
MPRGVGGYRHTVTTIPTTRIPVPVGTVLGVSIQDGETDRPPGNDRAHAGRAPLRAPNGDPQETTPYATTAVTVLELLGLLLDGVVTSFSPSRSADPDRNG